MHKSDKNLLVLPTGAELRDWEDEQNYTDDFRIVLVEEVGVPVGDGRDTRPDNWERSAAAEDDGWQLPEPSTLLRRRQLRVFTADELHQYRCELWDEYIRVIDETARRDAW